MLDDEELTGQIGRFAAGLEADARANALGAKLVQLTMPGVADTYQGCERAVRLGFGPGGVPQPGEHLRGCRRCWTPRLGWPWALERSA